jgi:hypothetical protein
VGGYPSGPHGRQRRVKLVNHVTDRHLFPLSFSFRSVCCGLLSRGAGLGLNGSVPRRAKKMTSPERMYYLLSDVLTFTRVERLVKNPVVAVA